jgi:hypothetical protein
MKVNLKPSEILRIRTQGEFEKFTKEAIRRYPNLEVAEAKTKLAKAMGYKAISASKAFDPLGGINIIDNSVFK